MKPKCIGALAIVASIAGAALTGCAARHKAAVVTYTPPESGPYAIPLISPGTKFSALPPAVQNTVRAETGSAEIEDIVRDTIGGRPVYRIYFTDREVLPPLYVTADGSVLNPDLTVAIGAGQEFGGSLVGKGVSGIKLGDLPPEVVKTIQQRAPEAELSSITRENRAEEVVYIVTFKDPKHPALEIAPDGSMVKKPAPIQVPDRRRQ